MCKITSLPISKLRKIVRNLPVIKLSWKNKENKANYPEKESLTIDPMTPPLPDKKVIYIHLIIIIIYINILIYNRNEIFEEKRVFEESSFEKKVDWRNSRLNCRFGILWANGKF